VGADIPRAVDAGAVAARAAVEAEITSRPGVPLRTSAPGVPTMVHPAFATVTADAFAGSDPVAGWPDAGFAPPLPPEPVSPEGAGRGRN
jgi:hypothetical protein